MICRQSLSHESRFRQGRVTAPEGVSIHFIALSFTLRNTALSLAKVLARPVSSCEKIVSIAKRELSSLNTVIASP